MDSHEEVFEEQWLPDVLKSAIHNKATKVSLFEKLLTAELALAFIAHDVRCCSLEDAINKARTALKQIYD